MKETIRVIELDRNVVEIKNIKADLYSYYKELKCSCIDIINLPINKKRYSFIIDDEGKLKEHHANFYIARCGKIVDYIANKCIICNFKETEDGVVEDSLTEKDIANIFMWLDKSLGILNIK